MIIQHFSARALAYFACYWMFIGALPDVSAYQEDPSVPSITSSPSPQEREDLEIGLSCDEIALATPYFTNTKFIGYFLEPWQDEVGFAALGLESRDILIKIDDKPVTLEMYFGVLYQVLNCGKSASLTIVRQSSGESKVIVLQLG